MAQEAILRVETGKPIMMKCADGTGIEKGSILKLTDPLTAALADGDEDVVAGIASGEKIASNGQIYIGVYREGIFEVVSSGGTAVGLTVATGAGTGASNDVKTATATAVGGKTLGIALEAASDDESFLIELKPGCNNTAYA